MNHRHFSKTWLIGAPTVALTLLLSGCGGGGGGGDGSPEVAPPTPQAAASAAATTGTTTTTAAAAAASTVAGIVPGQAMAWLTAADRTLTITVTGADGRPAVGAGVRVFSLSRSSPQDGAVLEQPVPVSLLDSAVSDAAGQVSLALQLPAHLGEVLIVATLADSQAQRAVATDGSAATVNLALAR